MRFLVFLLLSTGCSEIPTYVVDRRDLDAAQAGGDKPVPALREDDGSRVRLRPDSFRALEDYGPTKVRVGGLGRHSLTWKSGLALTVIGVVMSAVGGILVARSFSGAGDITEGGTHRSDCDSCAVPGFMFSVMGDALALGLGPGLWIAGARSKPVELP
jgi:hypothetical protein